jgi:hypothetical protein
MSKYRLISPDNLEQSDIRARAHTRRGDLQGRRRHHGGGEPSGSIERAGAQAWFKFFPRKLGNAEEALQQLYGDPLCRFLFKDFTHRYWGFPATEASSP